MTNRTMKLADKAETHGYVQARDAELAEVEKALLIRGYRDIRFIGRDSGIFEVVMEEGIER